MAHFTPLSAAIGGALIGLSSVLLMLLTGRIAGISGIFGGLLNPRSGEIGWRVAFIAGLVLAPLLAGLYFGRYVLRLNPLLLLGGLAGALTMTAGLAAVQERSGSTVAVLGYSGTVAIGHILLTTWGTVIVWLIAH